MQATIVIGFTILSISVISYFVGKSMDELSGLSAFFISILISIFLGIAILMAAIEVATAICSMFDMTEKQCIGSNQNTVWWFLLPIASFPAYIICMFIGRKMAGKNPNHETYTPFSEIQKNDT